MKSYQAIEPIQYILDLQSAKKPADKISILRRAWDDGCRDLFSGLQISFDPLIRFDLPAVPKIIENDDEPDQLGFDEFKKLINNLREEEINVALNKSSVIAWNEWYRKILLKSIDCIKSSQVNKFLKSVNNIEFLIPVIKPQMMSEDFIGNNFSAGEYYIDPYLSGDRILTVLQPNPALNLQFNKEGDPIRIHDFSNLVNLLPVGIVLDGVQHGDCYYLFDILPLQEYKTGKIGINQERRHRALCDLQDILADLYAGKVRILPKKRSMISNTTDANSAIDELRQQGYGDVVFKKVTGKYLLNRNRNWVKN